MNCKRFISYLVNEVFNHDLSADRDEFSELVQMFKPEMSDQDLNDIMFSYKKKGGYTAAMPEESS